MKVSRFVRAGTCLLAVCLLSACATKGQDYSQSSTLPPLDVPPDLSAPPSDDAYAPSSDGAATYSGFSSQRAKDPIVRTTQGEVLPGFETVRIERAGGQRWLVVKSEAEPLWFEIRAFLLKQNFLIEKQNPQTGIMETAWRESHPLAAGKTKNILSKMLGSLYSTGLRDKFHIRLERGVVPGTMELYLSHHGMEEFVSNQGSEGEVQTRWRPRASDPEREAEMLSLLLVHLGENSTQAKKVAKAMTQPQAQATDASPQRAVMARNAQDLPMLQLQDSFDLAWRRVGLALDRIGFTVEDRDRSSGLYYVRYIDPAREDEKGGFFSSMFGGKDKQKDITRYQIKTAVEGAGVQVAVLNWNGEPEQSKTGERILTLLLEQLR